MLFNSYTFLLIYLPIAWLGYQLLSQSGKGRLALGFLALMSIAFYGVWSPVYVLLLLVSIMVNYMIGGRIVTAIAGERAGAAKAWLTGGILFDLSLLAYYKYANFFVANLAAVTGQNWVTDIILPIGISFYTFTQIAYLVDARKEGRVERSFINYVLFVTFFPHLIAGPVFHHKEMMPQFGAQRRGDVLSDVNVGLTIFVIGLAKKVLIADQLALGATPIFAAAAQGGHPDFLASWIAALSYTMQLYFDFSGYSDMAIGLSRLFGVKLPMNFASPYKAASIIEFWRRWHITLSRFLRDYLYVPLGGNRCGALGRYRNVFLTMVLGGLWHGAGWTFLIWGVIHGTLITINHAWNDFSPFATKTPSPARRWAFRGLTFLCVMLAWVPFRAETLGAMQSIYAGMAGLNPQDPALLHAIWSRTLELGLFCLLLGASMIIALFCPNTAELMRDYAPVIPTKGYPETFIAPSQSKGRLSWAWQPRARHALAVVVVLWLSFIQLGEHSEFIYFQF